MKGAEPTIEALCMLQKILCQKKSMDSSRSEVQRNFLFYGEDKFLNDLSTDCGVNND